MATWKAENSTLTQKGIEILNKIKLGGSPITISRIVAGSGRVSESQIYRQTSVSGTQIEMTLSKVITSGNTSEMSFFVTNEGREDNYILHQIGIYVTHPDYSGEQLYFLTQCEEEGADNIPPESVTPMKLLYSLVLEHGNSDSVLFTVDPVGAVTIEMFDEFTAQYEVDKTNIINSINTANTNFNNFKAGVREKKLLTADASGNLVVSGKAIVSGTSIRVTDAIDHRALSLSVAGSSVQASSPTPTAPKYPVHSKVTDVRSANNANKTDIIAFPSVIELRGMGDYKDTIEWDGAKWWKVQRIAEVTVDGTTVSFGRPAHSNSANYSRGTIYTLDSANKVQTFNDALPSSSVWTSHGNDTPSTSAKFYGFLETVSGTSQVRVQLHLLHTAIGLQAGQKDATTRLNEIVAWLTAQNTAGTPVKVMYVLANPIVTEISITDVLNMYPTLTQISSTVEGSAISMRLGYALDTTDDTTMYILKSLARKSEIQTANTFALATVEEDD